MFYTDWYEHHIGTISEENLNKVKKQIQSQFASKTGRPPHNFDISTMLEGIRHTVEKHPELTNTALDLYLTIAKECNAPENSEYVATSASPLPEVNGNAALQTIKNAVESAQKHNIALHPEIKAGLEEQTVRIAETIPFKRKIDIENLTVVLNFFANNTTNEQKTTAAILEAGSKCYSRSGNAAFEENFYNWLEKTAQNGYKMPQSTEDKVLEDYIAYTKMPHDASDFMEVTNHASSLKNILAMSESKSLTSHQAEACIAMARIMSYREHYIMDAVLLKTEYEPQETLVKVMEANPELYGYLSCGKIKSTPYIRACTIGDTLLKVAERHPNEAPKILTEFQTAINANLTKSDLQSGLGAEHLIDNVSTAVKNNPKLAPQAMDIFKELSGKKIQSENPYIYDAYFQLHNTLVETDPQSKQESSRLFATFKINHPELDNYQSSAYDKAISYHAEQMKQQISERKEAIKARRATAQPGVSGTVIASKIADGVVSGLIDAPQTPEENNQLAANIQKRLLNKKLNNR